MDSACIKICHCRVLFEYQIFQLHGASTGKKYLSTQEAKGLEVFSSFYFQIC